jgi:hypothetical protein
VQEDDCAANNELVERTNVWTARPLNPFEYWFIKQSTAIGTDALNQQQETDDGVLVDMPSAGHTLIVRQQQMVCARAR